MVFSPFISSKNQALHILEKTLLDLGAYKNVSQACLMVMVLQSGRDEVVRFLETGSYLGFVHEKGRKVRKHHTSNLADFVWHATIDKNL